MQMAQPQPQPQQLSTVPAKAASLYPSAGPACVGMVSQASPICQSPGQTQARPPNPTPVPVLSSFLPNQSRKQESELLETVNQAPNCCDLETNRVRLVSLGCYCGPKLTFQKIGRGAETLPFDWLRCRMEAVFHFMRNNFEGFFNYRSKLEPENGQGMTIFRDKNHAFWHDDPTNPDMHEKYRRRIKRFQEISAKDETVLFVRVAGHTGELSQILELYDELTERFGERSRLLIILIFQRQHIGPHLLKGRERLLIWFLHENAHRRTSADFNQPYKDAVLGALDWSVGRPIQVDKGHHLSSLDELKPFVTPNQWGENGLAQQTAFEVPLVSIS